MLRLGTLSSCEDGAAGRVSGLVVSSGTKPKSLGGVRQGSLDQRLREALYRYNMVSEGRHPKQPIAKALDGADAEGFTIQRIQNKGHLWGALVCGTCELPEGRHRIHSTPRDPDEAAKRIIRFRRKHQH